MSIAPLQQHRVSAPPEDHPLPHSEEAERAILGAAIQRPDAVCPMLEPVAAAWHLPQSGILAATMLALWSKAEPVNVPSVTQRLRDTGNLDAVGGPYYVTSLLSEVDSVAVAEHFLVILREKHALRLALVDAHNLADEAAHHGTDPLVIADSFEAAAKTVREAVTDPTQGNNWAVKAHVLEVVDDIEKAYEHRGQPMGLSSGFKKYDEITGGLHPTDMVVIAARPSMGKTAFAMNIAEHVAVTAKRPVGVFSLEMSTKQLVQRMVCSRARVNLSTVRDGYLSEHHFPKLTAAAGTIGDAPMFIDDTPSLAISDLRAKARQMHKVSGGLALVVIDYIQLMRSNTRRGQENRQLEVAEISGGCKALAKELKIPVIVLAQLNRNPDTRPGNIPRLSDLRESGSIEQDADLVGFLHRPEYYAQGEDKQKLAGEASLHVEKQRNGPVGEVKLTFIKDFARFEDRADPRP